MTKKSIRFQQLDPPRNLTGELVARITDDIIAGKFEPNEKLPTEHEMIAAFGVSRSVVREAIAALRSEGLVETRQGAGAFVVGDKSKRPFRIDPKSLQSVQAVLDLMELRMGIEIEAAGLAAQRRDREAFRKVEKTLRAFEEAIDRGEDAVEADFNFHRALVAATGNEYFVTFLDYLGWHIIPRRNIQVSTQDAASQKSYLKKVHAEHKKIARAIEAGDPRAARAAMRRHLERGRERYASFAASSRH
jgi:GntR family transcriptional regulator, transcriptional repressor for pyruvate dehydrogenase complex